MSKIDDGGPAFPGVVGHMGMDGYINGLSDAGGMTLRDWFAGQALAGLCHCDKDEEPVNWDLERLAWVAYGMADAMLVARREKGGEG